MIAKVQETAELPLVQYIDEAVDAPIALQTPVPAIQTSQKTEEMPQVQHRKKVIDVPVVLKTPRNNHPDTREDVERYSDIVFRSRGGRTCCGAATGRQ